MASVSSSGTIQEIAFKLAVANQSDRQRREDLDIESTLFVLGSHEVGKTTIINKFMDREPTGTTRPTLALDYSFARRSASGSGINAGAGTVSARPVCHVWELGGGLLVHPATKNVDNQDGLPNNNQQHNLCDIPLRSTKHGLRQMRIVLLVDLSRPNRIWADLTLALARLNSTFAKAAAGDAGAAFEAMRTNRWRRFNVDSDDMDGVEPSVDPATAAESSAVSDNLEIPREYFPVPLLLIGAKYDIFKNFDPEIKKHVCRALRSVALLLGADALLFVSTLNAGQMLAVREWLNRFAFRSGTGIGTVAAQRKRQRRQQPPIVDHNEALAIVAGTDSWQLIGHMPKQAIAEIGIMLSAHIPPRVEGNESGTSTDAKDAPDPATDPHFREAIVDELRSQMDAERRQRWLDRDVRDKFHSMPSAMVGEMISSDF